MEGRHARSPSRDKDVHGDYFEFQRREDASWCNNTMIKKDCRSTLVGGLAVKALSLRSEM